MMKLISVVPIGEIKNQDRYILQNITLASSIISEIKFLVMN